LDEADPSVPLLPTGNARRFAPLLSAIALLRSLRRAGDNFAEARALTKATSSALSIVLRALLPLAADLHLLFFGPDSPTTNPYNPFVTPDVLDIVVTRDLPFSVAVSFCSALSSDHLPVLIDTGCRSTFQNPMDRPDVGRTDWAKFQTHLEVQIPLNPELQNGKVIDASIDNLSGAILWAFTASTPKHHTHGDTSPRSLQEFRMIYAPRTGFGDGDKSPGTPL
jgi:hypothetical protein